LTVEDYQLDSLIKLRAEIEGIDRATRNPVAAPSEQDSAVSYSSGMFSGVSPLANGEQTVASIVASVHALLQKLAPVATIETCSDGIAARTVVHYTGRAASVWSNGISSGSAIQLANLHIDSVRKTLAVRRAFVAAIGAVSSALVSISIAVANPLTVFHALASARALKQALEKLANMVEAAG